MRFFETGLSLSVKVLASWYKRQVLRWLLSAMFGMSKRIKTVRDFYDLKHDIEQLLPAQIDSARIRYVSVVRLPLTSRSKC